MLCTSGVAQLPRQDLVLAIEDIKEDFYRIDRMIWNLIHAGYDRHVKGVILGTFKDCGKRDRKVFPLSLVMDSLKKLTKGPLVMGARFGHGLKNQRILALGSQVKLQNRSLRYLEGVVR